MDNPTITDCFIDWVTAVAPTGSHNSWLRRFLDGQDAKPCQRAYHRSHALEYYPSGIRHYYSPHDSELDSIIVLDGNALSNIRRDHDNEWCNKVVAILARCSAHFSRVDLAVDIMDAGRLAHDMATDALNEVLSFGKRNCTVVRGVGKGGGTTLYAGARTSPKYMRIYDKNAESKGEIKATRIEFELKAESAQAVSDSLSLYEGYTLPCRLFTGVLKEFNDWEAYPAIEKILYGEVTTLRPHKRERLMERKDWLRKQVMPTFTKGNTGNALELWQWFKETVESSHSAS